MRPLIRPPTKYIISDIIELTLAHFKKEKNPRCSAGGKCVYGRTGCFVGCLLTQEDADVLDDHGYLGLYRRFYKNLLDKKYYDILNVYFDMDDPQVMSLLITGQSLHDDLSGTDNLIKWLECLYLIKDRFPYHSDNTYVKLPPPVY